MYPIEFLDLVTNLVLNIQEQLDCSFDEACEVSKILYHQVRNQEIVVDTSLKYKLPSLLEQVKNSPIL
jgi:hypothetical protein